MILPSSSVLSLPACKEAASAPAGGHGCVVLRAAELKEPVSSSITGACIGLSGI